MSRKLDSQVLVVMVKLISLLIFDQSLSTVEGRRSAWQLKPLKAFVYITRCGLILASGTAILIREACNYV